MGLFNKNEIFKYNLINKNNQVIPNYDLSYKDVYFEFKISPEGEVCIIGRVDSNYICWWSVTNLNDIEINEDIFNFIANNSFNMHSSEYKVLGYERYDEIRNWYNCNITKANIDGMYWQTPFGHYYGADKENHGKNFARDIQIFYNELIEKCNFRIYEGFYIDILKNYLYILSKDVDYMYYYEMKPLISILKCESYLRLSPDVNARELYIKCMEECNSLYNRYMTVVR